MYSQKIRLFSLNLVLAMLFTLIPVQAADIVIDDDGPLYTVVLDGNGGTYGDEKKETLSISYGNSPLYLEDYIFTKEGCTFLGWRESADESATTLDYARFAQIYGGSTGEDTRTLYAVWGEGENCALYNQPIEGASQIGEYWVLNSTTLPEMTDSNFAGWYDHLCGVYMSGEAAKIGEVYYPLYSSDDPIILDGNGGTSNFDGELFFGGSKRSGYFDEVPRSGARCFSNDGYILDGWTDENGAAYVIVTGGNLQQYSSNVVNGVNRLSARWSKAYQLTNGAKLVINGDEMNALLMSDSASNGNGWRFYPNGRLNLYGLHSDTGYESFDGIAYDGNFNLGFNGNVATGQIEANGRVGIQSYGSGASEISVETADIPAIHAESVELIGGDVSYKFSAANAVGVDASYIYLGSPNITIIGNPAVRADAQIVCHNNGISYMISEDRTTLTTYAIGQEVTLNGNGGTLDGAESVTKSYTVNAPLDLSQYAFTREGYELIGWAEDVEGTSYYRDRDSMLYAEDQKTLYAIWLEVPEDSAYAIFKASIPDAFSQYRPKNGGWAYSCVKIGTDFAMPKISDDAVVPAVLWRNTDNHNLYFEGELVIPPSGSWFTASYFGASNGRHTIVLDGNGGTYHYTSNSKTYNVNRQVVASGVSNGETVNYACNFTRPGYTLVSYNSEPDGSGTEYALNKCTVTSDMDSIQVLYAQWKKNGESGQYITVDGKQYDAAQTWSGNGWAYWYSDGGILSLLDYHGGSIESDVALRVSCSKGQNIVTGCISAPELNVNLSGYQNNGGVSLTVNAKEGVALISQGNMLIQPTYNAVLSVTGADGSPAVSAGGDLTLNLYDEGRISAQGGNTAAISAASISNISGLDYLITAGAGPEEAVEVDTYTNQQYVSYEVRTKTLTLHGNGGTADGKDNISADTKNDRIDLGQYANSLSNDGKVLLGWSKTENGTNVDYLNSSSAEFRFDSGVASADLYAVWESDSRKGVMLNGYGQLDDTVSPFDVRSYVYHERFVSAVDPGTQYTLPDSYKAGYRFLGWRSAQDGELYLAGTAITVEQSVTYTAEYEVLSMTINGKTYRMDRAHGSRSLGWEYRPAFEYGRWSEQVRLDVYENYSGKPVSIPSTAYITLYGNVTGESGQPAISVDGNAQIYSGASGNGQKSVVITGGAGAPAIQTSGNLNVDLDFLWDRRGVPLIVRSEMGQPALKGKKVNVHTVMLAGSSESDAVLTGRYRGESFVRISDELLTVTLQPGQTAPALPEADGVVFVAWRADGRGSVWYRPGDVIEGEEVTLHANYMWDDSGAVILDGNGGTTSSGSKYYVAQVSGADLRLTESTARNGFTRDGYTLSGYNDRADGSGRSYTFRQLADGSAWDSLVGKVLTFFAQWTRNGDPVTPEKPSKPTTPTQPTTPPQTTTPDGSADITVSGSTVKVENVDVDKLVADSGDKKTAEIDLSGTKSGITDVTLPTDAVKKVADSDAESLTVKLPDVTVSFDDKALAAVAEQSSGEDLSLSVNVGAANNSNLTDAQKNAITGARELSVIEVSLSSNGEKISNFNGGSVTIDIPFQWSMKGLLRAYYIDENGNKSAIDVTYKNGVATLVLNHFSTYVVEAVDALSFTDVSAKAYYFDAVAWAVKNKITSGQSDTLFAPDASCTRAQMVTFLWRANGSPEPTVTELPFTDVAADAYYAKAVLWAVENGITTGTSDTTFDPDGVVTRAEAVTFLWRAAGKPIAGGSLFADVESTKYYAEAVRWAVTSGITNGMSDSTFAPNDICTRAHIVTFLYRAYRSK